MALWNSLKTKIFESFGAITQMLWQKSKWKSRVWQNATNSIGVSCIHPAFLLYPHVVSATPKLSSPATFDSSIRLECS